MIARSLLTRAALAALVCASFVGCNGSARRTTAGTSVAPATLAPTITAPGATAKPAVSRPAAPITTSVPLVIPNAPAAPSSTTMASTTPGLAFEIEAPGWSSGTLAVALDRAVNGKAAWTPDAFPLAKGNDGRWRGFLPLAPGTTIAYKITRGAWAKVEKGPLGVERANRTATVGAGVTAAFGHVFHWADDSILPPAGRLQDCEQFKPKTLAARKVYVLLPNGYDDPKNAAVRYPVLYALDGQNLVDPSRSAFGVVWGLDTALDSHTASGKSAFVSVLIDNTPDRVDEYTPSRDASYGGGRLEELLSWMSDELKPAVDGCYRTKTGPEDTAIMGSSLGGLAAFHAGWKHSDVWKRAAAVSPSFWWNNQDTKALVNATATKPSLRLWVDIGTNEGGSPATTLANTRAVRDALVTKGFKAGSDLGYLEAAGGRHDEASWAARLPQVLAFLFP